MADANHTQVVALLPEATHVTVEFLQTAIRKAEKRHDIVVTGFTVGPATKVGDNFATVVLRANVKVKNGRVDKEYQVVIKSLHDNKVMNDLIRIGGLFEKEVRVYADVIPSLIQFQSEKGVTPINLAFPRFYDGFVNMERKIGLLVLEDLRPLEYKPVAKRKGFNYEHSQLMAMELAKFHALSLAMKDRDVNNLKTKFPSVFEETFYSSYFLNEFMRMWCGTTVSKVMEILYATLEDEAFKTKVKQMLTNPMDTMRSFCEADDPFAVICHGEIWCTNFLFKYATTDDGEEVPVAVQLLDLQYSRYALPTTDLAQLFYINTDRSVRRDHLKDLLKLYYSTFTLTLENVKFECPEFTYEVLEEMFKKTAIFGAISACYYLPLRLANNAVHDDFGGHSTAAEAAKSFASVYDKADEESLKLLRNGLVDLFRDAIDIPL